MRSLPTGLDAAITASKLYPVFMVELSWSTGMVRAWNGYHTLSWEGSDWLGVGHLGGISEIKESNDGSANGVTLTMSGIPATSVAQALTNDSQGRPARILFGVLSATGFVIEPYTVFDGLIDFPSGLSDGKTATISVNLEKELYDDRSNARRWNHADAQIDFPGEMGWEHVAHIAGKSFTWGKATIHPNDTTLTNSNDSE